MVQFDIITLFPRMFDSPLQESILMKARQGGLVRVNLHDLRDYTEDRHRTADDAPYGGGAGMVMKIEPIVAAVEAVRAGGPKSSLTILMSPQGDVFNQRTAQRLSRATQIIIVCGRYEGVDERVLSFVDEEISLGDYVLTGGEIPAMAIVDTVARLIPGVVGDIASVLEDSLANSLLKHPQYTRPAGFRGLEVPDVLTSGDHKKIKGWRKAQSLKKTFRKRPDLLEKAILTAEDRELVEKIKKSQKLESEDECN